MTVTIDLSEQNAAALESQARAAPMPTEHYLAHIVARLDIELTFAIES